MGNGSFWQLGDVDDEDLVIGIRKLVQADRRVSARLLAHLAEVEERRLHLRKASPSMFEYCLSLGMSEDEAGRRICAARVARRFPVIYALLDQGKLSLSVICKLKDYLSDDNHAELLAGVSGLSFRKAEAWLAARFARPDVPSVIRKLPQRAIAAAVASPPQADAAALPAAPVSSPPARACAAAEPQPAAPQQFKLKPSDRGTVEPLSSERHRVQFTATQALREMLELALDLMAHQNPGRDLAAVVDKGLDLLIAELMKKRFGQSSRPRPARASKSERVTSETQRKVLERDGLECTFVDDNGNRCQARALLEYDHRHPRGKGGASDVSNIRLLCKAHNHLEAERHFGRAHIERAIAQSRSQRLVRDSGPRRRDDATSNTRSDDTEMTRASSRGS
jgi:hypothetical protein